MVNGRHLIVVAILAAGCSREANEATAVSVTDQKTVLASSYNPANTGTISGQVTWTGKIPSVQLLQYSVPKADGVGVEHRITNHPNRPHINASTRAIGDVVISLRNVDLKASRPWDLPPVKVLMGDGEIRVRQDRYEGRAGFVRRGDAVSIQSVENAFHILRGRGSDFFSVTLPTPNDPITRTMNRLGRVELSSASGAAWMSADLFVGAAPYFTLTQADGRFELNNVPVGRCELVAWLPNWEEGKPVQDPEGGFTKRQTYAQPFERVKPVEINPGAVSDLNITLP